MANTISFINQKGGVGKTTTSVNTAAILAQKGYKVLLIDVDPQAGSTIYYGLYDDASQSIYDVMLRKANVMDTALQTCVPRLMLLPSVMDFDRAEIELSQVLMRQEFVLKDALSAVTDRFDFIVIDSPPSRSKITINALAASDYVVLPAIPDAFAIASIQRMSVLLNEVKSGINPALKVLGILVTIDEQTINKREYKDVLMSGRLLPCFDIAIRKNTRLSEGNNAHLPITLYDGKSAGAEDYTRFVDELLLKTGSASGKTAVAV